MIDLAMPQSRTIGGLIDEMAARYSDLEAIVDGPRRYTFADVAAESRDVAKALLTLGVRRGDNVAILMGNRAEWLFAHFGAAMLGATAVGVNTWSTGRELTYVLTHSEAKVLIATDRYLKYDYVELLDDLRPWSRSLPDLEAIVLVQGEPGEGMTSYEAFLARERSVGEAVLASARGLVEPSDVALLLYTSGSTSRPKGVLIQHAGLIENMWHIGERLHITPDDRLWLAVSLFWGFGCQNALYTMFTHGACLVLQDAFEPAEALRLLQDERCTVFYGLPNMVHALRTHLDFAAHDLSGLRTGITMGTPEQITELSQSFLPEVTLSYGMTELYGNCSVCDCRAPIERRAATGGPPLPGVEFKVVEPGSDRRLRPGEVGELRVRGYVTLGYHKDPELTARSFDDEGFFITGDLAVLDEEGWVAFRGRLKEMVKTGGINVSPAEVEEVLRQHPSVSEAYVIGLPDPVRDEELAAVVLAKPGSGDGLIEGLKAHARVNLAAYKVPRRFALVSFEQIPRTTTGKVQKSRLAELFAGKT